MPDKKGGADRRSFLKLASVGTLTGGALLAMGKKPADASEKRPQDGTLYRETDHVKTFYESTKF